MDEDNELIALRRKKLDALRSKGVEPFGAGFEPSGSIAEVREKFKERETLRAAGRITAHRDRGKSHFLDLRDATGRIQIYIHAKEVGAELIDLLACSISGISSASRAHAFSRKAGNRPSRCVPSGCSRKLCGRCLKNGTGCKPSRPATGSVISIFLRTSVPASCSESGSRLSVKPGASSRSAAFWRWRRRFCRPLPAAPRPNRLTPITRRSASICICASRQSFI